MGRFYVLFENIHKFNADFNEFLHNLEEARPPLCFAHFRTLSTRSTPLTLCFPERYIPDMTGFSMGFSHGHFDSIRDL